MPLQEVKDRTDSFEFLQWLVYLDEQEIKPPTRTEQYLAQIALEVRKLQLQNARSKKRVSLKDMLMSFTFRSQRDTQATALTPEEVEARKQTVSKNSQASWLAFAGIKKDE